MVLILSALAAAGASLLTFYSGFGLVTLLTPVFLLFFPAPTGKAARLSQWTQAMIMTM